MRCVQQLNESLQALFASREDLYLLGEDIGDPYGGAFKVTRGLSERWPDRVISTPISEASLFGIAAGMSMRGLRPILEIMFGDFMTLGFDQIVNHISKFRAMYHRKVNLPLVVRLPMGGGRRYGPTHSQSLEKFLLGVPHIAAVAISEFHDVGGLLVQAVDDDRPVFFIEHKLVYGRMLQRPEAGYVGNFLCTATPGPYPALTFSSSNTQRPAVTIATYGGMVATALDAATELLIDDEILCEVVAISRLHPLDLDPIQASVQRTHLLVTVEEGGLTAGIGAEIAASIQQRAWRYLDGPIRRVAARDSIIPPSPALEDAVLPNKADIIAAVRAAVHNEREIVGNAPYAPGLGVIGV